ncbi:NAD(P)-dependent oxidoreductase [Candidatus Marsarchaeota archaeon]|nr:NAD(P)-dependent oxidoreductase [Candidatus Marsarchaeota archaeon]MCL5404682.1 NAD(P)-dependent oxidoreductase [Candidatus Marsarchaeota archaeon]
MPANSTSATIDLVTGSTSGIGRALIEELVKMGHEVRALIRTHPSKSSEWKALPPKVKVYAADLTGNNENDLKTLAEACAGVDNIFHIASAVYNYKNTYDELINTNVVGTENLLNAYESANKGSRKQLHIIYASSMSVYGQSRGEEQLTESSKTSPASPYAESKLMAEQVIKSFADANPSIKYTILRFGTFYGENYNASFFKIFKLIEEEKAIYIRGGTNHITLIHQADAVNAMLMCASNPVSFNKTYNITDGKAYTIKELFEFAAKQLKVNPPKRSIPHILAKLTSKIANINYDELEFLSSNRRVSIAKAQKELGFNPSKSMASEGKMLIDLYLLSKKAE